MFYLFSRSDTRLFKNVTSSTSHKKNFGMNANITKMQIFDDMKFDLMITLT